ncbi:DMT family transporter [Tropicimonas marinistellae]|uniref:DMT family transporter n=1 Tax=Tropicimonas marinistellae TaxID=1739787 RepID=UPI000832274A|nr:DMT family transporter [Tropicimonas marinistellae]
MIESRPLLGLGLMLAFCALAPLGDAFAKLLSGTIPLFQLLLVRYAIQTLILWPLHRRSGSGLGLPPAIWGLLALRTALHIAAIGTMIVALRYLPLADAIAIAYVMPFILLFLGRAFLGETVGRYRLAACVFGFLGTLMVTQPSFSAVGWPATMPMLVALFFALFMLTTRQLAGRVPPISLQAISGLLGTLALALPVLLADGRGWPEFDPVEPTRLELLWLACLGVTGTVAHLLMTYALRFAPAAVLAPVQYLEIPFAVFYGRAIFGEWPNPVAVVGIVIIIGAGLYILRRERLRSRVSAP